MILASKDYDKVFEQLIQILTPNARIKEESETRLTLNKEEWKLAWMQKNSDCDPCYRGRGLG